MRYVRVCMAGQDGDPGLTLYEVDAAGGVHRQVQLGATGPRFAPEDVLICTTIDVDIMCLHPAAEEILEDEFEVLWTELSLQRNFRSRIPDPKTSWEGWVEFQGWHFHLMWLPYATPPRGWSTVRGFVSLFVRGDERDAHRVARALFIDAPVLWSTLAAAA